MDWWVDFTGHLLNVGDWLKIVGFSWAWVFFWKGIAAWARE